MKLRRAGSCVASVSSTGNPFRKLQELRGAGSRRTCDLRFARGENIEAPISPGLYEVRFAGSGALHSFGAVDNVAQALSLLPIGSKSWFGRRETAASPDLEYRTCATSSKAAAKAAAERMIGRRETYMSGAA